MGATNLLVQQLAASGASVTAINSGVPQNQISDIAADIPGRITNYNPDVVVILIGVNDVRGVPTGPPPLETFRTNYATVVDTVKATLPNCRIMLVSILYAGEKWASVPPPAHFAGNTYDATIDAWNNVIRYLAESRGCVYVDGRGASAIVEPTGNTPEPGAVSGFLTDDQVHQLILGQQVLSNKLRTYFTVA